MAMGALEQMQQMLLSNNKAVQSAYADSQAINNETIGALSRPRRNQSRGALAMAAGFLSPTRSGSFGESLGKVAGGYSDALDKDDELDFDRDTKLAHLKQAQIALRLKGAGDIFNNGMRGFELPGLATKYLEGQEDYHDTLEDAKNGGSGLPTFPKRTEVVPPAPGAGAPAPAPASTVPSGPNATVGSMAPVAQMAQAQEAGLPPGTQPGDDAVHFPDTGGQTAALGDGPIPQLPGVEPGAEPPAQPVQMAQAQTGQPARAPAQPAPPSIEQQQYDWALQVRQMAMENPGKWARRPKYVKALSLADKVIDDYRASQNAQAMQTYRGMALDAKQSAIDAQKAAQDAKDPYKRALEAKEAGVIADAREKSRDATGAIQNVETLRRLRDRPTFGTGPIAGIFSTIANYLPVNGSTQALDAEGVKTWVSATSAIKGALSEREGTRFDAVVPGKMMDEPEANLLLDLAEAGARRLQQQGTFLESYRERNGTLAGADLAWQKFIDSVPLVTNVNGQDVVLKQNIDGWRKPEFLTAPEGLSTRPRAATDSAPARQLTPEQAAAYEELQRRQKARGAQQ